MTLSERNDNPSIITAEIYNFNPHYNYHCDVMQVIIPLHLFRGKEKNFSSTLNMNVVMFFVS